MTKEMQNLENEVRLVILQYDRMMESASRLCRLVSDNPQYFPNIRLGDDCVKGIADWLEIYVRGKNEKI